MKTKLASKNSLTNDYDSDKTLSIDDVVNEVVKLFFVEESDKDLLEALKLLKEDSINLEEKLIYEFIDNYAKYQSMISEETLYLAYREKLISTRFLLEFIIIYDRIDIIELLDDNGHDIIPKDINLINSALRFASTDVIQYLNTKFSSEEISSFVPDPADYFLLISNQDFVNATTVIDILPKICEDQKLFEFFRAFGANISFTEWLIKYNNLLKNYKSTNQYVLKIFYNDLTSLYIEKLIQNEEKFNNTEFNIIELILIGRDFGLFEKIATEYDIKAYINNDSFVNLCYFMTTYSESLNQEQKEFLVQLIADNVDNIDVRLSNGESLVDILVKNPLLKDQIIEKTNDPLFALLKKDADLMLPSKQPEFVHIAISNGEGFWSTGVWSVTRLIKDKHPNVKFHLITKEMILKSGDEFIKQFDGVINPGGGDSYPFNLSEFTKNDCKFQLEIEQIYQLVLDKVKEFGIPLISMCAGAQHLVLHSEGSLAPLKGYNSGQHTINFIKGTLAHFFSLTTEQQQKFFDELELPDVIYLGDTAHNYAAVSNRLGEIVKLGAISEENIPMAYTYNHKIWATQFHPEHYYNSKEKNAVNQTAWLDNFIELTKTSHEDKLYNGHKVQNYMKQVDNCLYAWNFAKHLFDEVEIIG